MPFETVPLRYRWMRERAQRADSAIIWSGEDCNRSRSRMDPACAAALARKPELPRAMQALRTSPRHLVRLIGLPRKSPRKSASVKLASHSSLGSRNVSSRPEELSAA